MTKTRENKGESTRGKDATVARATNCRTVGAQAGEAGRNGEPATTPDLGATPLGGRDCTTGRVFLSTFEAGSARAFLPAAMQHNARSPVAPP